MAKLTIGKARLILGKLAENLPDDEIDRDIKVAEILSSLFFQYYIPTKKQPNNYNKNTNGKT